MFCLNARQYLHLPKLDIFARSFAHIFAFSALVEYYFDAVDVISAFYLYKYDVVVRRRANVRVLYLIFHLYFHSLIDSLFVSTLVSLIHWRNETF